MKIKSRYPARRGERTRWPMVAGVLAALAALGAVAGGLLEARNPEVSPIVFELDGPGENVDDPCFWVDPNDPAGGLIFVTTKDSGLVEVFSTATGGLVTTIPGFERPNNCAVEGDLLLTTDRGPLDVGVKIHSIPDFTLVGAFADDMIDPHGIDIFHDPMGQALVYVTDGNDASVHVYDLVTGNLLDVFDSTFNPGIEPVVVDDLYDRIFVAREEPNGRGIGLFTPAGTLVKQFGASTFSNDTEGLALYRCGDGGYLVAADQGTTATEFEVFDRITLDHIGTFRVRDESGDFTNSTDGIDILQMPVPGFENGVLAACDGCGSTLPDEMDLVAWERIADALDLDVCRDGVAPDCIDVPCIDRIPVSADAYVTLSNPSTNFGNRTTLEIDASPLTQTFVRFVVPDLTGFDLLQVRLRMAVDPGVEGDSDVGGVIFLTTGSWAENTVTWNNRPMPVGLRITTAGPVSQNDLVDFDLSQTVVGPGTYSFAVLTTSANRVVYRSREAGESPPVLLLTLHASAPPEVFITSPADGATVSPSAPLALTADAIDLEDGPLSAISWQSDRDGFLGTGPSLSVGPLTAGTHTISATATDGAGLTGTAVVQIHVTTAPTVSITAPTTGSTAIVGTPVALAGTASDAEDGNLNGAIAWTSSRDGQLGTGPSLTVTLSLGTHVLTAAVTDSHGSTATATVNVEIQPPPTTTTTSTSTSSTTSTSTSTSTSSSSTTSSSSSTSSSTSSSSTSSSSSSSTTSSSTSSTTSSEASTSTTVSTSSSTTSTAPPSSTTSSSTTSSSSTSSTTTSTVPGASTTTSTTSPSPTTSSSTTSSTATTAPPASTSTSTTATSTSSSTTSTIAGTTTTTSLPGASSTTTTSSSTSSSSTVAPTSTTSTSRPPTTSSTSTSSTTTSSSSTSTSTTIPDRCGDCDDGDECTIDRCDPARGCLHEARPSTEPAAVECGLRNVRTMLALPPPRVTRQMEKMERLIAAAADAPRPAACRRKLRAAVRSVRALQRLLARLTAEQIAPGHTPFDLAREAIGLGERVDALAAGLCSGPARTP